MSASRLASFRHYVLHPELFVGFLYVTGTVTAQSSGSGIISGYKIEHNTAN